MSDELVRTDETVRTDEPVQTNEAVETDDLGLTYDPEAFRYVSPARLRPRVGAGKMHEEPDIRFLEEVAYRPVFWLWAGRIPGCRLTVIEGPPQSGKSLVAMDLAARVSRGEPMPGEAAAVFDASSVQLVGGHEDLHDTVLPRIRRAGGIISSFGQISHITRSRRDDEPADRRKLSLPADIAFLEESIGDVCPHLVIVDPLTWCCKSGRDVALALELLDDMASRICIPIIATLSAQTARDALGRWESRPEVSDAPARCVWSIVADQDEPGRWLFVPVRMTFATPAEGLAFRVVNGRIAWEPLPVLPLADHDESVAWLWSLLQGGPMHSPDIRRQAKEYGISDKMLRRARRLLRVDIRGEGRREDFTTIWSLPEGSGQPAMVQARSSALKIEPQA